MTVEDERLALSFPQKPIVVERALGARLWTRDGRTLVDLGGANHGVANLGHNHPRIVEAMREQLGRVTHVPLTIRSPQREAFLERLHRMLPNHLARTFLSNSGAEANEAALKFAHARTGRTRFVALRNSFHGRTLGALATTLRSQYRKPFERLLPQVEAVAPNDVAALERTVTDETAAVLIEPIQGEGGVVPLTHEFLRASERVAHAHGALLIVDEIQTGVGRTGHDVAVQAAGVRPDVLTLGKSLAGGLPMGATAVTEEVAKAMPPAGHGSTFGGNPFVCAAGAAALDVLAEERLSSRAATLGERLRSQLARLPGPLVREVRGAGLMLGLDLRIKPQPVIERLLAAGFVALPAGNTVLRFLPPLVIDEGDLTAAVEALRAILVDPGLVPTAAAEAA